MPTTFDQEKHEELRRKKDREGNNSSVALIIAIIVVPILCSLGFVTVWNWLISTGGLP